MVTALEMPRTDQGVPKYQVGYSVPAFMSGAEFATYRQIRENAADLLAQLASAALTLPYDRIVIRDILSNADLGLQPAAASNFEQWQIQAANLVANQYNTVINRQLPQTKLLAVCGIMDFTFAPALTVTRFYSGNAALWAQVQMEKAYGFNESPLTIVRPTLIWNPNDTVRIDVWATASQAEAFLLDGFIAEAVGQTVAPPVYG